MNVYIWTDSPIPYTLKNDYIGKVIEYDFTTQNVLTFKQQSSSFPYGYTAGKGYYIMKTGSTRGTTLWSLPSGAYGSNVKKITIQYSIDNDVCGFLLMKADDSTWVRSWKGSGGTNIQSKNNGTVELNESYTAPTGNTELVLDLLNKTVKYGTGTYNLTSGWVSTFRTERANKNICIGITNGLTNVGSSQYYTYMGHIIIEY